MAFESRKKPSSRWKFPVGAAAIVVLVFVAAPMAGSITREFPWALRHLSWNWLLTCVLGQGGVYACLAGILAVSLGALGYCAVTRQSLLLTGAAFLLANRAVPGPAVAGLAVLVHRLKREKIPSEAGQAVAAAFYASDYAGFLLLSVIMLPLLGREGHLESLHASLLLIALLLILLTTGLLIAAYCSTGYLERVAARTGYLWAVLRRRRDCAAEWGATGTAWVALSRARAADLLSHPRRLLVICGWALLMHVCEVITLVLAVRAFGGEVTFSTAAAGYIAGNLGAIISFLPGGAGLYEGGMVTALHAVGGLPVSAALAATLLYRLLTLWLPMPFALIAVRHALTEK